MALKCNPPNKPCGGRCIGPDEVCGGKDNKVSSENNNRLKGLTNAIAFFKKKKQQPEDSGPNQPNAPRLKPLDEREVALNRRQLDFDKSIRGKSDNDITLRERLTQRNLKKERESINLEKREANQRKREEDIAKRNNPDPAPEPETPKEDPIELGKSIMEALDSTQGLLEEATGLIGIEGLTDLTGAAKDTLQQVASLFPKIRRRGEE